MNIECTYGDSVIHLSYLHTQKILTVMDLVVPFCSFHLLEYRVWINKKSIFSQMNIDRKANWPSPKDREIPLGLSEGPKVRWPSLGTTERL